MPPLHPDSDFLMTEGDLDFSQGGRGRFVLRLELITGKRNELEALVGKHPRKALKRVASALRKGAARIDEAGRIEVILGEGEAMEGT